MTDPYDYWRNHLAGQQIAHPMLPQPGRYRMPAPKVNFTGNVNTHRTPTSPPVAIWPDGDTGKLRVRVGTFNMLEGEDRYLQFCDSGWHSCEPVTLEHYERKVTTGSWDDESQAVTADNQRRNAPDHEEDSFEDLKSRIADLESEARALIAKGAAKDKAAADKAADLQNRLSELAGKAEKKRVKEKEPHLVAGRAVDSQWQPIITLAGIYKNIKNVVINPWLKVEQAKIDEANKKAEFEALITGARPEEIATTQLPKAKVGTRGRGVSSRDVQVAKITDQDALYQHFRTHEDVIAVLTKLANASAKSGVTVPGMEIEKDTVAI
jgi:hypothetical protein